MFRNLVRRLTRSRSARPSPRRPAGLRPAVEALESRVVPTVLIVAKPGSHYKHDFTTIQAAVNAANPGDTIKVEPGTYQEQVTVSKNNLSLMALPANRDGTKVTIQAPASGSGALVDISGQQVTLKGFWLEGLNRLTISYGVFLHDGGSGTVAGNNIAHLLGPTTAQAGYGIFANTTGQVTINGNTITNYHKGGIVVEGGAQARVVNNQVIGDGPTGALAQNGIQIGDFPANSTDPYNMLQVAQALVKNNTVTGNIYANTAIDGFESGGILIVNQVGNVQVLKNSLTGNQDGLFLSDVAGLDIERNDASGNTADGILMVADRIGDPRTGNSLTYDNVVARNNAADNGRSGIDLFDSDHNIFERNQATGNAQDGFTLNTSDNNVLSNNQATDNANDGIALFWSNFNVLERNKANNNAQDGIALLPGSTSAGTGSNNNVLDHNHADDNGRDGIRVEDSQNNVLMRNHAFDNGETDINLVGDTTGTVLFKNHTSDGSGG
jgi:parallel beta-helix repeat protein